MASLFKRNKDGKTVLSSMYNAAAIVPKECIKEGKEFVKLFDGKKSSYLDGVLNLDGEKRLDRSFAIVTSPLFLNTAIITSVVAAPCMALTKGVLDHLLAEEQKPPQNKFDKM